MEPVDNTAAQTTDSSDQSSTLLNSVAFDEKGLVPAIAQDSTTGQVLMMAWMNAEALAKTVAIREAVYFSRSRQRLWHKGESSGHTQRVHSIRLDCDGDVVLLSVEQVGGIACHTGRAHCFYRELDETGAWQDVEAVLRSPAEIYGQGGTHE